MAAPATTAEAIHLAGGQKANTQALKWLLDSHDSALGGAIHKEVAEGRAERLPQSTADQALYRITLPRPDGSRAPVLLNFRRAQADNGELHLSAVQFGDNMVWRPHAGGLPVQVPHPAPGAAPGAKIWFLQQQKDIHHAAARSLSDDHPLKGMHEERRATYTQRLSATLDVQQKLQRLIRQQAQLRLQLGQPLSGAPQDIDAQLRDLDGQLREETLNFQIAFAGLSHRPVNDQDRAPFRQLERDHAALFKSGPIRSVPEGSRVNIANIRDVDMGKFDAINAKDGCAGIGTRGAGPCIAVCARGVDKDGLPVLGIYHHDGLSSSPDETLETLAKKMQDKGAVQMRFSLIGGRIMPVEEEAGSYQDEKRFLELQSRYPLEGVRLHVSEGEEDAHTGEDNSVNVALMPNQILYGRDSLYH